MNITWVHRSVARLRYVWAAVLVAALGAGLASPAAATITIYADNFSGMASDDLNGTTPDIAPVGAAWIARTGTEGWKADGSKNAAGNANAFLPFTPVAGNVYKLSVDANPKVSGSSDWFSLGFSESANAGAGQAWHVSNPNVHGWMLLRENDAAGDVIQMFRGAGTANGSNFDLVPDVVGPVKLSVVLDTTQPNWTVQWFAQGNAIRGPEAYGTNPINTSHVGLGALGTATGAVDNFSLTIEGAQVGLGADLASATNADSSGSRMNVEGQSTLLDAHLYKIESFEYLASGSTGDIQPFLAVATGADTYEVVWVGPTLDAGAAGAVTELFADEYIKLSAASSLFAGFNATNNIVMFADPDGPSTTDHNNPANFSLSPGDPINSFTNANLARNYAFAINLTPLAIPEPATAALALLGVAGLLRRRRRVA